MSLRKAPVKGREENPASAARAGLVARALELGAKKRGFEKLKPGVEICRLAGDAKSGPSGALLRYAPGARVPALAIRDSRSSTCSTARQSDERGTYPAGTLVVNRMGGEHSVWSEKGCLVLVIWERPIELL